MAEGAPLLREYGANNSIEGSNPSLSAMDEPRVAEPGAGYRRVRNGTEKHPLQPPLRAPLGRADGLA